MNSRLVKIFFSCSVALFITLVCFNNIIDHKSQFQFVHMVANMEDTFSNMKSWRSVNNEVVQNVLYILIVAWELSIAVLMWLGAFKMITKFRADTTEFKIAKKFTSLGLSLGVLLWFTVFIAIAGEWFLMWQSKSWNAQYAAFFLTGCFLLFLINHNQEDI
ncbi:MAG: DUF2165 domain-containing protein [Chitinophagaceae bacterium]